jgi:signal transduction histidine kinase
MSNQLLKRDATITMAFVQSIGKVNDPIHHAPNHVHGENGEDHLTEFFTLLVGMPDVVGASVYLPDRTILWSSQKALVGKQAPEYPMLDQALSGELAFARREAAGAGFLPHIALPESTTAYLEYYIPMWDMNDDAIIFVAEVYKNPDVLLEGIRSGMWVIWVSAIVGGLVLYTILLWIVYRASFVLQAQQQRLIESETMAAIGEMASAVAHGIRNPLAAIRTSAELALDDTSPDLNRESAEDIITEVDRMDQMIRELILIARHDVEYFQDIDLAEIVRTCADEFSPTMERQSVALRLDIGEAVPPIQGDPALLRQALGNVIANALDAMPNGGSLAIGAQGVNGGRDVTLTIADDGHGIAKDRVGQVFKPFVTSKRAGLGIGLSLVKRIIERHGGNVALSSEEGKGTTVSFEFPVEAS